MFSCRLNDHEYAQLEDLLSVFEFEESKSDQFRELIRGLSGVLTKDLYGHLVLEEDESEYKAVEQQPQRERSNFTFPDFSHMKSV